ncbi:MAG: biopolymer transporter ExbD [Verrucomicrobiota bacterium]
MARRFKAQDDDEVQPELDIAPLIDVAFLLLIYFLVTSQLKRQEIDLNLGIPSNQTSDAPTPPLPPLVLEIQEDGTIVANPGKNPEILDKIESGREVPLLEERLAFFKAGAEASNDKPTIILNPKDEASGQRFVDVLNAIAGFEIDQIALAGFAEGD